jgi:plastocyanin
MKRGLLMVSILAVLVLVMAACGGTAATPAATETPAITGVTPTATAAGSAGAAGVEIKNFSFNPAATTIKVGDTVTWTNNDSTTHTVTGSQFNSGPLDPGKTFSFTFATAGTFDYACTIHPNMKGQIVVQ